MEYLGVGFWITIGLFALIVWFIALVNGGHEFDESMRAQQLTQEARQRWPRLALVDALDLLWREKIKELKKAVREGRDTDDLERDYRILLEERQRLIELSIQNESGYEAMPGRISG